MFKGKRSGGGDDRYEASEHSDAYTNLSKS